MTRPIDRDFLLAGPDDFVRLDSACADLMKGFFSWLLSEEGGALPPEEATPLAHAADRYLRDFVVDILETGPADPDPAMPRQYLGNWYVVNTLSPSHEEMDRAIAALRRLCEYLAEEQVVPAELADAARQRLQDAAFFHRRLEEFWALTPEGIDEWRRVDDYRGKGRLRALHAERAR